MNQPDQNFLKQLSESCESLKAQLPSFYEEDGSPQHIYGSNDYQYNEDQEQDGFGGTQSPEPEQTDYDFDQQSLPLSYLKSGSGSVGGGLARSNGSSSAYRTSASSGAFSSSQNRIAFTNNSNSTPRRGFDLSQASLGLPSSRRYDNPSSGATFQQRRGGLSGSQQDTYGLSGLSSQGPQPPRGARSNSIGFTGGQGPPPPRRSFMEGGITSAESHLSGGGAAGAGGYHIDGTKVFVNNIEANVRKEEIDQYFSSFGKINDMKVFHRADQHYAYVIYSRYEDAFSATNTPAPNNNWSVSLAKSKNTVMQYQQSTMFSQTNPQGALPFRPNQQKFYPSTSESRSSNFEQRRTNKFNNFRSDDSSTATTSLRNEENSGINSNQSENFPAESHLANIINNCRDNNQLVDLMMMPAERVESLASNRTQINQTILVREIWISSIHENCESIIREVLEDNFGPVEKVEFFRKKEQSFAFVKFYMVQTAYYAFSNKEQIAKLLETDQIKLTYSDPSRRRGIIGDNKEYMMDENLSPVLYVSFPFGFKVNKKVIQMIASDYGTVLNVTVKRSEDPKQTTSVLIEFKDLKDTKFAYENMCEDQERMNPKCEYAILLNSEKFIKEKNLKLKDKTKDPNTVVRQPTQYVNQSQFQNNPFLGRRPFSQMLAAGSSLSAPNSAPFSNAANRRNSGDLNTGRFSSQLPSSSSSSHLNDEQNGSRRYDKLREFTPLNPTSAAFMLDENAAGIATPEEEEEGDDENVIWSGFISVKQKGRCGMDAKLIQASGTLDFEHHNLNMTTKTTIAEALRNEPYATIIFKPSNDTATKPFTDVKMFLNTTPDQAGVIQAKNFIIYLLPNCPETLRIYPSLRDSNILAVCHTPESQRGNNRSTKKDEKILSKYDAGKSLAQIASPSAKQSQQIQQIIQTVHIEENENEEEDEEYDPNQIQANNHSDISDLIDNPSLLDSMLKSLN